MYIHIYIGVNNNNETSTYPIMSMQERMLSVLGCKYVSDVLMDAPYVLSDDMLSSLNISAVLMGSDGGGGDSTDLPGMQRYICVYIYVYLYLYMYIDKYIYIYICI
jgi:glycerol-3-phosphate cytidylyltransferase-like family protein